MKQLIEVIGQLEGKLTRLEDLAKMVNNAISKHGNLPVVFSGASDYGNLIESIEITEFPGMWDGSKYIPNKEPLVADISVSEDSHFSMYLDEEEL